MINGERQVRRERSLVIGGADGAWNPRNCSPRRLIIRHVRKAGIVCGRVHGDRKSTRLNSSHSQISYAVFCLKKKKEAVAAPIVDVARDVDESEYTSTDID